MSIQTRIDAMTEQIHRAKHGDQCPDIHPVIHGIHLLGFRKAAEQMIAGIKVGA